MSPLRVATDEDAFLSRVAALPEEYLDCRTMQHSWVLTDPLRVVDARREKGARRVRGLHSYARRIVTCTRCQMKRHDAFEMTSRHGHTALRKVGAYYDTTDCPDYPITGMGNTMGMRDLLLGSMLDTAIGGVKVRPGRPRKRA